MAPHGPPPDSARETQGDGALPPLVREILGKLARDEVECLICKEVVERSAPIWSCNTCFNSFHLSCVREWVRQSATPSASTGMLSYHCPVGCTTDYHTRDYELAYTCFCGRRRDPPEDDVLTPHSCGERCSRPLAKPLGVNEDGKSCPHVCVLQCHPGPCPPCTAMVACRPCLCGKQTARRCTDRSSTLTCGRPCDRLPTCGRHRCKMVCHNGDFCGNCTVLVSAICFCGKTVKELNCGEAAERAFAALRCAAANLPVVIMLASSCVTRGAARIVSLFQRRLPDAIAAKQNCRRKEAAVWTKSPPATRYATINYLVDMCAKSSAMRENAHPAQSPLSRSAVVALPPRKAAAATRNQLKRSAVTSPAAALRTVGGIGALICVVHWLLTVVPIFATYHVARSSNVGGTHASSSATVVIAQPAWNVSRSTSMTRMQYLPSMILLEQQQRLCQAVLIFLGMLQHQDGEAPTLQSWGHQTNGMHWNQYQMLGMLGQ